MENFPFSVVVFRKNIKPVTFTRDANGNWQRDDSRVLHAGPADDVMSVEIRDRADKVVFLLAHDTIQSWNGAHVLADVPSGRLQKVGNTHEILVAVENPFCVSSLFDGNAAWRSPTWYVIKLVLDNQKISSSSSETNSPLRIQAAFFWASEVGVFECKWDDQPPTNDHQKRVGSLAWARLDGPAPKFEFRKAPLWQQSYTKLGTGDFEKSAFDQLVVSDKVNRQVHQVFGMQLELDRSTGENAENVVFHLHFFSAGSAVRTFRSNAKRAGIRALPVHLGTFEVAEYVGSFDQPASATECPLSATLFYHGKTAQRTPEWREWRFSLKGKFNKANLKDVLDTLKSATDDTRGRYDSAAVVCGRTHQDFLPTLELPKNPELLSQSLSFNVRRDEKTWKLLNQPLKLELGEGYRIGYGPKSSSQAWTYNVEKITFTYTPRGGASGSADEWEVTIETALAQSSDASGDRRDLGDVIVQPGAVCGESKQFNFALNFLLFQTGASPPLRITRISHTSQLPVCLRLDHNTEATPGPAFAIGQPATLLDRLSQAWIPNGETPKSQARLLIEESWSSTEADAQSPSQNLFLFDETKTNGDTNQESVGDVLHVSWRPFWIAKLRLPRLRRDRSEGALIAQRVQTGCADAAWQFTDLDVVDHVLPPQAVGEQMEKGLHPIDAAKPVQFRLSPNTVISYFSSDKDRRYAPLRLRSLEFLDAARVKSLSGEFFYPIHVRFETDENRLPEVRASELAFRYGTPCDALPPHEEMRKYRLPAAVRAHLKIESWSSTQQDDTGVQDAFETAYWSAEASRWNYAARLAVVELHRDDQPQGFHLKEQLQFDIRANNLSPENRRVAHSADPINRAKQPINDFKERYTAAGFDDWTEEEQRQPRLLHGGALYMFDFQSELIAVLENPTTKTGSLTDISLSALGAWGEQGALFNEDRTLLFASFEQGQVSWCKKETIGRIGCFWNRAKHVVVYRRTVAPSRQFTNGQPAHFGRPILRKVEEYIELLEVERPFAKEAGAASRGATAEKLTGCIKGSHFHTVKIPVDSDWGQDLRDGFYIPLWRRDVDQGVYPRPQIAVQMHGVEEDSVVEGIIQDPEKLVFYSNQTKGAGADTDAWPPRSEIDFPQAAPIGREKLPPDAVMKPGQLPSPLPVPIGYEQHTYRIVAPTKANLNHSRNTEALGAVLEHVTLSRGVPAPGSTSTETSKLAAFAKLAATVEAQVGELVPKLMAEIAAAVARIDAIEDCVTLKTSLKAKCIERIAVTANAAKTELSKSVEELRKGADGLSNQASGVVVWIDELAKNAARSRETVANVLNHFHQDLDIFADGAAKTLDTDISSQDEVKKLPDVLKVQVEEQLRLFRETLTRNVARFAQPIHANQRDPRYAPWLAALTNSGTIDVALVAASDALKEADPAQLSLQLDAARTKLAMATQVISRPLPPGAPAVATRIQRSIAPLVETGRVLLANIDYVLLTSNASTIALAQSSVSRCQELRSAAHTLVSDVLNRLPDVDKLSETLADLSEKKIGDYVDGVKNECLTRLTELQEVANDSEWKSAQQDKARECVAKLKTISVCLRKWADGILAKLSAVENALASAATKVTDEVVKVQTHIKDRLGADAKALSERLDHLRDKTITAVSLFIDNIDCANAAEAKKKLKEVLADAINHPELAPALAQAQEWQAQGAALADDLRAQYVANVAPLVQTGDSVIKLVRAFGEAPDLPQLTFNRDRIAYYIFDIEGEKERMLEQIRISPAAVKLREAGEQLKALGLNLPTEELSERFQPYIGEKGEELLAQVKDLIPNIGGLDLSKLFDRVKMPNGWQDAVNLKHGFDKQSGRAWAEARVNFNTQVPAPLFDVAGLKVVVRPGANFSGNNRIEWQAQQLRTISDGALRATWDVQYGGQSLVAFRDLLIKFDQSGKLDVELKPENIELHPTLKFVSDLSKSLGNSVNELRDAVENAGLPIAVNYSIESGRMDVGSPGFGISNLQFGAGFGLNGRFDQTPQLMMRLKSNVGHPTSPLIVSIGQLSGAAWLTQDVQYDLIAGRLVVADISLALAAGSVREINLGSIARGQLAVLFFAEIRYRLGAGGMFVIGVTIYGNARIIGYLNANVSLLLEARSEGNDIKCRGTLSVSIEISRFYTFRVRSQVERQLN